MITQCGAPGSCYFHLPCTLSKKTHFSPGWQRWCHALSNAQGRRECRRGTSWNSASCLLTFHTFSIVVLPASCTVLSFESLFTDLPDLTSPLTFCRAASVNQPFLKTDEDTASGRKKKTKTTKPNQNRPIHLFNKAPPSSLCSQSSLSCSTQDMHSKTHFRGTNAACSLG